MTFNDIFIQVSDFLALGGPIVAILAALSVVALAIILLKVIQFAGERVAHTGRAKRAVDSWLSGNEDEASRLLIKPVSVSEVAVATAVGQLQNNRSNAWIEEEVTRLAKARLHALGWGLRALDSIAQLAPLLGLFGTVLGMIEAFQQLQSSGDTVDPSALAGGIWVALLTTAAGLAVAMPVSLVVTWFETRIENEKVSIETLTTSVLLKSAASQADARPAAVHLASEVAHAT